MSLTRLWEKIKAPQAIETIHFDDSGEPIRNELFRRLFLSLIIILVSSLSFTIGRLTGEEGSPIKIEYDESLGVMLSPRGQPETQSANASEAWKALPSNNPATASTEPLPASGGVVASKNGSKYHYAHCPGAKQIKEENRLSFRSAGEAEASGYALAANCKPR